MTGNNRFRYVLKKAKGNESYLQDESQPVLDEEGIYYIEYVRLDQPPETLPLYLLNYSRT